MRFGVALTAASLLLSACGTTAADTAPSNADLKRAHVCDLIDLFIAKYEAQPDSYSQLGNPGLRGTFNMISSLSGDLKEEKGRAIAQLVQEIAQTTPIDFHLAANALVLVRRPNCTDVEKIGR